MSIGRLVVELELNDGQYTSRMTQAGRTAQTLSGQLNQVNRSLGGIKTGISGAIPHLRDIAVVTSGLHSVFSMASDTIGKFAGSLIKANAEVERTSILLQGLSKSIDTQGKIKDAAKDMNFLFETAKQAPFALKELSNSFVKMKVVGMSDVENKLKNITNAIASFGGTDESLHRTTVALQQMASKGVISMEELRQQLGESVPSAMQNMSDGMGMTMSSMVKAISEGKVRALPAIDGMMQEMEFSMEGASARMMQTWNGMFSQLETNWMLFQKKVGDGGSFDAIKKELGRLNDFLQSDSALKWAQTFGDALKTGIDTLHSMGDAWSKNSEMIGNALKMLLEFWAVSKLLRGASNIVGATGIGGVAESIASNGARATAATAVASARRSAMNTAGFRTTTTSTPERFDLPSNSWVGGVESVTKWAGPIATVLGLLRIIPGPIGLAITAVGIATSAFDLFGTKASHALDDVIEKQKELNQKTKDNVRVEGDAALKTIEDINSARSNLQALKDSKGELSVDIDKAKTTGFGGNKVAAHDTSKSKELEVEYTATVEKIALVERLIQESSVEWFNRTQQRQIGIAKNVAENKLSITSTQYKNELKIVQATLDEELKANKVSSAVANEHKLKAWIELHQKTVASQLVMLEEMKKNDEAAIENLKKSNPNVTTFINKTEELKNLEITTQAIRQGIAKTKAAILETKDGGKESGLATKLIGQQKDIDLAIANIGKVKGEIEGLKASGAITENDLIDLSNAQGSFDYVIAKMKSLIGYKNEYLDKGILKGSEALITGDGTKSLEAETKRFEQAKIQLAKAMDDHLSLNNPNLAKTIARQEDGTGAVTPAMRDAANERINTGGDFKDKGKSVISTSMMQLETSAVDLADAENVKKLTVLIEANVDALNLETKAQDKLNEARDKGIAITQDLTAEGQKTLANLDALNKLPIGTMDRVWAIESDRGTNPNKNNNPLSSATGDFQITKDTAPTMGIRPEDRTNNAIAAPAVAKYIGSLLQEFKTIDNAMVAYKIGPTGFRNRGLSGIAQGTNPDAEYLNKFHNVTPAANNSKQIVELERKIAELEKNGSSTTTQKQELSKLKSTQSEEVKIVDIKKYNAEVDRIDAARENDKETHGKYLNTLHTSERKEQRDADALASRDAVKMYNAQIEDFKATNLKNLENHSVMAKGLIADELKIGKYSKEVADEKLAEIDAEIAKENERATTVHKNLMAERELQIAINRTRDVDNTVKSNNITRMPNVTSRNRAVMSADESNAQAIDKIKTDKATDVSGLKSALDVQTKVYKDQLTQIEFDHRNAFQIMAQESIDFNMVAGQAAADFTNGMIDGMAQLATGGATSFKQFTASVLAGIAQMLIKMALLKVFQMGMGMFSGGGTTNSPSVADGNSASFSSSMGNFNSDASKISFTQQKFGGIEAFATGGTISATKMSKGQMLKGGVKNKPHVALFAEAGIPEAFIPMQDGKSIPISVMKDAAGNLSAKALLPSGKSIPASIQESNFTQFAMGGIAGNVSSDKVGGLTSGVSNANNNSKKYNQSDLMIGGVSITVNVDNKGNENQQKDQKGSGGAGGNDMWDKMADNIKGIVIKTITEQKRPGGQLWS